MNKNILLAATAASVMAHAGAASAHTLTFRTLAEPTSPLDLGFPDSRTGRRQASSQKRRKGPPFK